MTRLDLSDSVTPCWMKLSDVLNYLLQQNHFYDAQRIAREFPDRGIHHTLITTAPDYGFTVTGDDVVDFETIRKLFPGNPIRLRSLRSHVARYAYQPEHNPIL